MFTNCNDEARQFCFEMSWRTWAGTYLWNHYTHLFSGFGEGVRVNLCLGLCYLQSSKTWSHILPHTWSLGSISPFSHWTPPPTDAEGEYHKVSPVPWHVTYEEKPKPPNGLLFGNEFLPVTDIILSARKQLRKATFGSAQPIWCKYGIILNPDDRDPWTEWELSHIMSKKPDLEFNPPIKGSILRVLQVKLVSCRRIGSFPASAAVDFQPSGSASDYARVSFLEVDRHPQVPLLRNSLWVLRQEAGRCLSSVLGWIRSLHVPLTFCTFNGLTNHNKASTTCGTPRLDSRTKQSYSGYCVQDDFSADAPGSD